MGTDLSSRVTDILNASVQSIESVIPGVFQLGKPTVTLGPIQQVEVGVLIGITGEVKGRLFISSNAASFASLGKVMFGMDLEGEMVYSFASEFTNMVAGNMLRIAEHIEMDISPPTTLEGGTKLYGFTRAIIVPLNSDTIGQVNLALIIEEQ